VYGADDPTLAGIGVTLGGLVVNPAVVTWNGNVAVNDTGNVTASVASLARASGENVGSYGISSGTLNALSGSAAGNYTGSLDTTGNTLAVTARAITVSANAQSKIYGDLDPALTYTVGGSGLANNPAVSTWNGNVAISDTAGTVFSGALGRTAGENVAGGPYAINQNTLAANSNYTLTTYTVNNLAITPAALSIQADNASRAQGTANPSFTATYTGFKLSETPAVLGGALVFFTPATVVSPSGFYSIAPSGQTSSNYAVTYVNGVLAVGAPLPLPPLPAAIENDLLRAQFAAFQRLGISDLIWVSDCVVRAGIPIDLGCDRDRAELTEITPPR
jgi:MBG domain (YGX type)